MIMRIMVLKNVDNEDKEGYSGWTYDDDWSYSENEHSDKDDESSGDSEGENGESKENSGDCGEPNVILVKIR